MNIAVLVELFLAGLGLGFGPCFLFCLPIVFPYIIARKYSTVKEGLGLALLFSLGRVVAYAILAVVAISLINAATIQKVIFKQIAGGIIILVGLTHIVILKKESFKFCNFLHKYFVEKSILNMFMLGLLIGLSPCMPLIGILTYIVVKSNTVFSGFVYGIAVGIGTAVSPVIIAGIFAGKISNIISKSDAIFSFVRLLSGLILIYFGLKLIL